MKRFFVTDLDKTLLDDQHGISPANLQALHRLEANHVQVILATGRAYHDVSQHILQRYHLNLPVIALNGAMIVDETGHLLKLHALDLKGLEEALAMLNKADAFYLLYTSSGTYTHEVHSLMANLAELAKTKTNDPQMILQGMQIYYDLLYRYPLLLDPLQTKSCLKLEIVSADEKMRNDLKQMLSCHYQVSASYALNLEVTSKQATKGQGVLTFSQNPHAITVIGDHDNDLAMFDVAGYRMAVANATAKLKAKADWISTSYVNDGFASAVAHYLDLNNGV